MIIQTNIMDLASAQMAFHQNRTAFPKLWDHEYRWDQEYRTMFTC